MSVTSCRVFLFGVLTEIDVKATLKAKLGEDMEDYLILGACNPPLAHRAVDIDRQIVLLLSCNVVVRTDPKSGDTVLVEAMDPQVLVDVTGEAELRPVADEVTTKLQAAIDSLGVSRSASSLWFPSINASSRSVGPLADNIECPCRSSFSVQFSRCVRGSRWLQTRFAALGRSTTKRICRGQATSAKRHSSREPTTIDRVGTMSLRAG